MFQTFRKDSEDPKPFELNQVVNQVVLMLKSTADARGVSLKQDTGLDKIDVELPEGQIKQVLYNLGRNALQACSQGQSVCISAQDMGDCVQLAVEDSGSGIEAEMLPFIFEPYFSTKNGVTEPSMGLGLSICKRLVEAMGGTIDVTTRRGQGSTFTVELPFKLSLNNAQRSLNGDTEYAGDY
jgi:signal transduction histidine kinase